MGHKKIKFAVAAVAMVIGVAALREAAIAQSDADFRRAAFESSKESVKTGNYADAVDALQPLAEADDALAQYSLGVLYAHGGKDLPQDYAKALSWFRKAAEKRDAASMRELAIVYEKGLGVAADPAASVQWYDKASNRGDAFAQLMLGEKYAAGQAVPKDNLQAYKWLTLASSGVFYDDEEARRTRTKKDRTTLAAQMSAAEVSQGEKLVLSFSAQ